MLTSLQNEDDKGQRYSETQCDDERHHNLEYDLASFDDDRFDLLTPSPAMSASDSNLPKSGPVQLASWHWPTELKNGIAVQRGMFRQSLKPDSKAIDD